MQHTSVSRDCGTDTENGVYTFNDSNCKAHVYAMFLCILLVCACVRVCVCVFVGIFVMDALEHLIWIERNTNKI